MHKLIKHLSLFFLLFALTNIQAANNAGGKRKSNSTKRKVVVIAPDTVKVGTPYRAEIKILNPDTTATYEALLNGRNLSKKDDYTFTYSEPCLHPGSSLYRGYVEEKKGNGNAKRYDFQGKFIRVSAEK
ncbi:MAG: hypothetical protein IK005_09825 [Paludibacteraceae bacterium]|nr:hypothetical protein [Paludibacteraceae bacterium]MBR4840760.1 hypothetical protein [Paludibacteraceae bacterium]